MSGATAADYAWLGDYDGYSGDSGFCVTFVHDLSPEEAFRRIGVTPAERAGDPFGPSLDRPIAACAAIGGTVLVETGGYAGTLAEVTRRLSEGTVTAAVHRGLDPQFVYAADGQLVTGFEPDAPYLRWGRHPDRLLAHMRELGMPTGEDELHDQQDDDGRNDGHDESDESTDAGADDPVIAAVALAERATGVRVTAAHLARPALVGSAAHLY
ncbi:DUF6461 domain-containing protein [Sphaerisporangium sp. NBC_01403]|uniref:DUF6461 domain-containing protein n=1 Tax=Sphaerisporangium sp. NBC_01403 TaxID=2903599 RepID=UPI00324400AA